MLTLTGCLSVSNFQQWSGPDEYQGKGGSFKTVDGIDVYSFGEPFKRYKVIGTISNTTISDAGLMAVFGNSWATGSMVKKAKQQGADAIILLRKNSDQWTTGSTDATGNYRTETTANTETIVAIVKYIDTGVQEPATQSNVDIDSLKQQASRGDITAQWNLGLLYYQGNSRVQKDLSESIKWLTIACDANPNCVDYRKMLARVYEERAMQNKTTASPDFAIHDLSESMKNYPVWTQYAERAVFYARKGDTNAATDDFKEAITLNPQGAETYFIRAFFYYNQHMFTNSLTDCYHSLLFTTVSTNNTKMIDYSHLYIWIIRSRLGEKTKATEELQTYLNNRVGLESEWTINAIRYSLGQLSETEFLKTVETSGTLKAKGELCEYYFFCGVKHLIEGDSVGAKLLFNKCVAVDSEAATKQNALCDLKLLE